ncbi:MATE family efflux transporter, partial [Bacteroides heparinolyticus]
MIQQENLKKRLTKLAAPIFIETLLIMMLGAVDTFMLSRYSDNSVAAVGVVNQIIMLTFLVFEVINLGTSVLCSQYLGAKLQKNVVQVVGISILMNFVIGITISLILYFCARPILHLMGLTSTLMQDGMDYMRIVGAFAFFQALSLTLSASLRSANKAVYPMMVTVVVNILNIVGNYSLIFGRFGFPELGVEGAAISTAFSRG